MYYEWLAFFLWVVFPATSIACFDGTTVCEYTFVVRRWRTMTYTAPDGQSYRVEMNGTRLQVAENAFHFKSDDPLVGTYVDPRDVITADGHVRDIITINDKFPGPTLHVMAGDTVVVHVDNQMAFEAMTIHWHGLKLQDNPWMDGVPHVTQCPIQPRQKFIYRFKAEPHGTHWYHSHLSVQHIDGLYGLIVIHPELPTLTEFTVSLNDWFHEDATTVELEYPSKPVKPGAGDVNNHITTRDYIFDNVHAAIIDFRSGLVNGRGRYGKSLLPLETFSVTAGERHRFRIAHTGADYAFEVSIDGHLVDIVALDGENIVPIQVNSFIIYPGETVDFELRANQPPGRYWLRALTLRYGYGIDPVADGIIRETKAIIKYDGVQENADPTSEKTTCTTREQCTVFNCPYAITPPSFNSRCIHAWETRSRQNPADLAATYGLDDPDEDVIELFYNFAFWTASGVGMTINSGIYVPGRVPLYSENAAEHTTLCDTDCEAGNCECTVIHDLPFNKTVQLVLTNQSPGHHLMAHHAIHLHSHQFAVLKMGFPTQDPITGRYRDHNSDVDCFSENRLICSKPGWAGRRPDLNKVSPPLKNTVIVPARGYTVVRFRTTTPGFWMMHCHMTQHFMGGMSMVFNEAPGRHPPPPQGFPTCHDFAWADDAYTEYLADARRIRHGSRPSTPATIAEATTSPVSRDQGNRGDGSLVTMNLTQAIGVAFGFILLGAVLPLISIGVYACCAARSGKP